MCTAVQCVHTLKLGLDLAPIHKQGHITLILAFNIKLCTYSYTNHTNHTNQSLQKLCKRLTKR